MAREVILRRRLVWLQLLRRAIAYHLTLIVTHHDSLRQVWLVIVGAEHAAPAILLTLFVSTPRPNYWLQALFSLRHSQLGLVSEGRNLLHRGPVSV